MSSTESGGWAARILQSLPQASVQAAAAFLKCVEMFLLVDLPLDEYSEHA